MVLSGCVLVAGLRGLVAPVIAAVVVPVAVPVVVAPIPCALRSGAPLWVALVAVLTLVGVLLLLAPVLPVVLLWLLLVAFVPVALAPFRLLCRVRL